MSVGTIHSIFDIHPFFLTLSIIHKVVLNIFMCLVHLLINAQPFLGEQHLYSDVLI